MLLPKTSFGIRILSLRLFVCQSQACLCYDSSSVEARSKFGPEVQNTHVKIHAFQGALISYLHFNTLMSPAFWKRSLSRCNILASTPILLWYMVSLVSCHLLDKLTYGAGSRMFWLMQIIIKPDLQMYISEEPASLMSCILCRDRWNHCLFRYHPNPDIIYWIYICHWNGSSFRWDKDMSSLDPSHYMNLCWY